MPELWGGLECTFARLRNRWRDQLAETGHRDRLSDIEAMAELGIKALRYPVLWEMVSPRDPDEADFSWHDPRLAKLHDLGIAPIAGLVHHGSGPCYTDLLDPAFPELLARHARRVAERYPWITRYTPVNEPLTTARFSGLYGYWYPHRKNSADFARALINQCRAIMLAMREIRAIVPCAELIQTEDLGKIFSSPLLEYQADFENERRWLTFDLLLGKVDRAHPWFALFQKYGIAERELTAFVDEPCPPDVIGINHYLTSERFLEHRRSECRPGQRFGGNGRHRYADLEAVRMALPPGLTGPEARLREASERYERPIAVTEVHHGCTRDEQLRWLAEVWDAACKLRREGKDIRAVTLWALFGTVDWNSLLLRRHRHYDAGAFDVRGPAPRKTALFKAAKEISETGAFSHPVLDAPGWWHRGERFYRPAVHLQPFDQGPARKLLITGAAGTLGRAFSRLADHRGLAHVLTSRAELDIAEPASVEAALARHKPWAVINAAGYTNTAAQGLDAARCLRDNAAGAAVLARACARAGVPLVTFSSDLVFDGRKGKAYVESDPVCPTSPYGKSKTEAERMVLAAHEGSLVIRTGPLFGPWDPNNFVFRTLRDLAAGQPITASATARISPAYVPDLVHAALDLLIDDACGIWHLANPGEISWYDLARRMAEKAGLDTGLLIADHHEPPLTTALGSERGTPMRGLNCALGRYLRDLEVIWRPVETIAAE